MKNIAIYKSALLWEIDLVRDTFTELKIPHYVQSEKIVFNVVRLTFDFSRFTSSLCNA